MIRKKIFLKDQNKTCLFFEKQTLASHLRQCRLHHVLRVHRLQRLITTNFPPPHVDELVFLNGVEVLVQIHILHIQLRAEMNIFK